MSEISRKSKIKLNIIDVVIILLVLALIATAAFRIYEEVTENTSAKQSDCILTFEFVDGTDGSILDYLNDGDAVYIRKDGTLLGYFYDETADDGIEAVYQAIDASNSTNGTVILRGTIKLSIDAHKAQNGEYYVINGTNITEGGTLEIYTEKTVMNIVVKSLSESK